MKKKPKHTDNKIRKFWNFLWYDDSIESYILNFVVAFIVIKFLFFPFLGLVLNNDYPIVAIVSGSMEHKIVNGEICGNKFLTSQVSKLNTEEWWGYCSKYYKKNYNLSFEEFEKFKYQNGLNIGDVMILYGKNPSAIEIGEVLVFVPQDKTFFEQKGPVIHRVVEKWEDSSGYIHFRTKGDHNSESFENFENDISEDNVIGVASIRVPYLGYAKIILNNIFLFIVNIF